MARDYALEYEREKDRYRRLTVRIPADMAEAFYAYCEEEDMRPSDWVLTRIFELVRGHLDIKVVEYNGFLFDWAELMAEMDPQIVAELRAILPPDTTNEKFLEQYVELDPSIYQYIDPFGAPEISSEPDED